MADSEDKWRCIRRPADKNIVIGCKKKKDFPGPLFRSASEFTQILKVNTLVHYKCPSGAVFGSPLPCVS